MFGRWCSNLLVDRPYHFAMMNVTAAVSSGQVQLMWIDNGRHRLMHAHVAMMEAAVGGGATIVHSDEHPFEYFRYCCCCCYCCGCHLICYSMFDLPKQRLVVAVVAIAKYFLSISVLLDFSKICEKKKQKYTLAIRSKRIYIDSNFQE